VAHAVNEANQIVGYSATSSGAIHAFFWSAGAFTDLGVLPGMTSSQASAINSSGQVVGWSSGATSARRAFKWDAGTFIELPPPTGYCCSEAFGINDNGDVVGAVSVSSGHPHAAIWREGVPTDLQATGGEGFAWDVNASGQVVGTFYTSFSSGGPQGSFVWTESGGLQLLGGSADGGEALAINNAGDITGWSAPSAGQSFSAYLWKNGAKQYLGTLGGFSSAGLGLSDGTSVRSAHVVGWSDLRRGTHAFVWTEAGGIKDLGLPKGRSFGRAEDVNSSGWAVGWTTTSGGQERATLWKLP
jgi:probable HAF family extracellular repeat protein